MPNHLRVASERGDAAREHTGERKTTVGDVQHFVNLLRAPDEGKEVRAHELPAARERLCQTSLTAYSLASETNNCHISKAFPVRLLSAPHVFAARALRVSTWGDTSSAARRPSKRPAKCVCPVFPVLACALLFRCSMICGAEASATIIDSLASTCVSRERLCDEAVSGHAWRHSLMYKHVPHSP